MLDFLNQSTVPSTYATTKIDIQSSSTSIIPEKQQPIATEKDEESDEKIALFCREEIKLGELVGSGSFSEVYEISSFELLNFPTDESDKLKRRHSLSLRRLSGGGYKQTFPFGPSRFRRRQQILAEHSQNTQDQLAGRSLHSRYVIKHLHPNLLSDPKLFKRAVRDLTTEATLMQDMVHPHIARLRGVTWNGAAALENGSHDSFFLVLDRLFETLDNRIESWNKEKMQICPGDYLDDTTSDQRLALKANYCLQIADALRYLHDQRIIFRDLKPQNIGFKEIHPDHPERDVLVLLDFGLARHLPVENRANNEGMFNMSLVGTRRYMAPEVVLTKTYNKRADTYSWALLFFEMVTQQRPYDGIHRDEHKEYICRQGKRPKLHSHYGLPKDLETMLRFAWAQDVSKRLDMSDVCQTLKTFLAGTIHEHVIRAESDEGDEIRSFARETSSSSLMSGETLATEQSLSSDPISSGSSSGGLFEKVNLASAVVVNKDMTATPNPSKSANAQEDVVAARVGSASQSASTNASRCPEKNAGPRRRAILCQRLMKFVAKLFR